MKKILAIAYITLLSFTTFAQNYNQNVNFTRTTLLSGKTMVQDTSLYIKSGNDTIRITNYGDTSRFTTTAAAWKFTPPLPTTSVSNIYNTNGTLTDDRTVNANGNDIIFNDAVNNIGFGITESPIDGNISFLVIHTDSGYSNLLLNKLEQVVLKFTSNGDITGAVTIEQSTNNLSASYAGVDNVTDEVFSGMIYISATNTYEVRLDVNGLRIKFDNNPTFQFKPSGIINAPLPTYVDDAAAGVAGLVAGDLYQTVTAGEGFVKIKQ